MPFFLNSLKNRGHLENVFMTICNVGSRKRTEKDDYGSQAWGVFAPNLAIYGFDADADACEAANADVAARQVNWKEQHLPYAISDTISEAMLYVTSDPGCSSLYEPNASYLQCFEQLRKPVNLEFTVELETTTLDKATSEIGVSSVDFLQIDVPGTGLQVLRGATQLLSHSVLAIQIRVEFSDIYLNAPLFADVDRLLREQGFTLLNLSQLAQIPRGLVQSQQNPGQLLWSDAIYVRDPIKAASNAFWTQSEQVFKLGCIADALEFTDFALELMVQLTLQHGNAPKYNLADVIAMSFSQIPGMTEEKLKSIATIQVLQPFLIQPLQDLVLNGSPIQQTTFAPPVDAFHSDHYLRHNQRRLEHLASLGLDLVGHSVLEVGAGIGDHTSFFLDRGCQVVSTEGRVENLELLQQRFPQLVVQHLDLNNPDTNFSGEFDIVYCYGLLYHLHQPAEAIAFMASHCGHLVLLETCVSYGEHEAINFCEEPAKSPTQSVSGKGCRPTRLWVFNQLKKHFSYVYMPITQPTHEEFPLDWTTSNSRERLTRAVFIASRQPLINPLLVEEIPMQQRY